MCNSRESVVYFVTDKINDFNVRGEMLKINVLAEMLTVKFKRV
jgi:hypothetical protein